MVFMLMEWRKNTSKVGKVCFDCIFDVSQRLVKDMNR